MLAPVTYHLAILFFMAAVMGAAWLFCRRVRNGGWTDVFWTFGTGVALAAAALAPNDQLDWPTGRQVLGAALVLIWSARLGGYVASQAAARYMGQGGRIINIGSTNAERMPFAGGAPYAMSKSALVGLTRGMARDLGPKGITVNNVQPGPVDTDMNPASGEFADSLIPLMAIGRYGEADEIASFVAYLAGPEAGYITGASLTVDGGFAA